MRTVLRSKIHRAWVTDANPDYIGSILIDEDLMDKIDLWNFERVLVCDVTNGNRFEKYAIAGDGVKAITSPLMETFGGVAVTTVIIYGGWGVINESTTPGAFFSFITALIMAYRPMKSLAGIHSQIQEGLAGAERYYNIIFSNLLIL